MTNKRNYSKWIRPLLYSIDLSIIVIVSHFILTKDLLDISFFLLFWIVLSIIFSFYQVHRFTKITEIVSLLSKQVTVFILLTFAYLYINGSPIHYEEILRFFLILILIFNAWRILLHKIFRKYRIITGSNYKQVVIIGFNDRTKNLENFFKKEIGLGYKYIGFFTNNDDNNRLGTIDQSYSFILDKNIDEVYCSLKTLSNNQIKEFIEFCDINLKTLKFIPDTNDLYSKNIYLNYYDLIPIISIREIPLDDYLNSFIKRSFDIVFSVIVIVFILSWLIPILGIIIKLESKGPIFFMQNRPGIKEKGFGCFKFRSMQLNTRAEDSASKNDPRVTKVGRFIRKTSIDELPQFFNVLFGSMSVVGPRPHLWRQNELYGTKISKYMVRHFVKPGITGLAQVRGHRGEIQTKKDILHRTKYDIFYVENWSLLLDFNIIIQTTLNAIKADDKAY